MNDFTPHQKNASDEVGGTNKSVAVGGQMPPTSDTFGEGFTSNIHSSLNVRTMDITDKAYNKAIEVLTSSAKRVGFYASGLKGGYEAVWARDSMVASLGACLVGDKFKKTVAKSIELLSKNQSQLGQIPNCVGSYNMDRRSDVTFNTIDSNLWYLIGQWAYASAYGDLKLSKKHKREIFKAFMWLKYQDPDEVKLLVQQPTMDWFDAFPHKYGYTINTQALYYSILKIFNDQKTADYLKQVVNGQTKKYLSLYDSKLGYYLPWAWKNHDGDREHEEWFDSLGNLLAIVSGLATDKIAKSALNYIERKKINQPFACKTIWPPIAKGDKEWHSYFSKCDARKPYQYSNAGVWPFIGGFYVAALVKVGKYKKAQEELNYLAKANMQKLDGHEFNEWLDGKTGKPKGEPYQAWSAGTYIYAYQCLKVKKVLYFN